MTKPPRAAAQKSGWSSTTTLGRAVSANGVTLGVTIIPCNDGDWAAAAIESRATVKSGFAKTIRAVFDDHNHKVLGVYPLPEAIAVAERYMAKWKRAHRESKSLKDPCECGPIATLPRRKARSR